MNHSTGPATKAQLKRFQLLQRMGCIACWMKGVMDSQAEIHHIVDKGTRKHSGGHDATIPLCPWHHRGILWASATAHDIERRVGPSFALNKRRFIEKFGTERALLAKVNDLMWRYEQQVTYGAI